MKAIDAVLEIDGSQQEVWDILADFESYPLWNPYLRRVRGKLELEGSLDIAFMLKGQQRRLRGKITLLYPPNEFRLEASLGLLGLLSMEHTFHVECFEEHRVCLVQRQTFSGMLATPARIAEIAADTKPALEAMNLAVKTRVESGVRTGAWLG